MTKEERFLATYQRWRSLQHLVDGTEAYRLDAHKISPRVQAWREYVEARDALSNESRSNIKEIINEK